MSPSFRTPRCPARLLHDQNEEQLTVADLRSLNDEWAAFAQFGCGLENELIGGRIRILSLPKFQIHQVTPVARPLSVHLQGKVFARGEPVFLSVDQRFARLSN